MGFTRWPLTFCSQQDGVVINCWSLRAWTLLGPHFKRALRLCLLAESSVADRPGYGPISSSTRAHLEGSTLAENETLCLLMFSHDIFINTQSIHPYTSVIFLLSRSLCEALMRNIRGVFRIVPSAAVLLSSLPTKMRVSLSALATKTNEYLSHADLQVLSFHSRTPFIPLFGKGTKSISGHCHLTRGGPGWETELIVGAQQVRSWIAEPGKIHKLPQRLNHTLLWLC